MYIFALESLLITHGRLKETPRLHSMNYLKQRNTAKAKGERKQNQSSAIIFNTAVRRSTPHSHQRTKGKKNQRVQCLVVSVGGINQSFLFPP